MSPARCPLTYEELPEGIRYSERGLRRLSPLLRSLNDLPYDAAEQRIEARKRAHKMSVQGVQPKLSARLSPARGGFEIVDQGGRYILKPQNELYPELPQNEDVSLRLAAMIGIEVPLHGLVYSKDGSLTFFIKRFDRERLKVPMEDFAQLSGKTRETKYESSMEQVVAIIERYASFPMVEKAELWKRTLFNYLIGNEDMHLKNFSLITRNGKVTLAPAYDFLNTTIVLEAGAEELALPLRGKRNKLTREDMLDYFAQERLGLPEVVIQKVLSTVRDQVPDWYRFLEKSFLSKPLRAGYGQLIQARLQKLE